MDSVFAIQSRSVLEQRAIPIDKNPYKDHFVHFEDKQNQSSLVIETNAVKGKFVRQKPIRNQLSTCNMKIGEVVGPKSGSAMGQRTDKNRYIEAPRVISYRFLSIRRLLR